MYLKIFALGALSCLLAISCNKKSPDAPKPVTTANKVTITSKMGSVRNWHGHHSFNASGPHYPTPINEDWDYPDTSFALTIINDTTIDILGHTFLHESTDSTHQIHFFGDGNGSFSAIGKGVKYYYGLDSIVFQNRDRHATTDYWLLDDVYYTY